MPSQANPLQATLPNSKSAEPLKAASVSAGKSWRAAATLGCALSPAGRFYALFGLLTAVKRQLFLSQGQAEPSRPPGGVSWRGRRQPHRSRY